MNILNMLGLMTTQKHNELRTLAIVRLESALVSKDETIERVCADRHRLKEKLGEEIAAYKEGAKALHRGIDDAVAEIEAQKGLVSALTDKNVELVSRIETLKGQNEALKTDAEKLRNKRANDAALKREKRAAAKIVPIKAARR